MTAIAGKYVSIGGSESVSVGGSNGTLSLNGKSLDINGATGVTGSISWVDENQRKAFGLGITKGIVTYLGSSDY